MITPEQLAKPNTEDAHQMALMCWTALELQAGRHPELAWLHHVPNGEQTAQRGAKMRGMGLKSGVWDLCLPVRRANHCGLYIEMKRPDRLNTKDGGLSENQIHFRNFVEWQGYKCNVCYSWIEASAALQYYLAL